MSSDMVLATVVLVITALVGFWCVARMAIKAEDRRNPINWLLAGAGLCCLLLLVMG